MDDLESLVALNLSGMVGTVLHRRLVERFGSAAGALKAPVARLREVEGVGAVTAQAIASAAKSDEAKAELDRAGKQGVRILPCDSPDYPAPLKTLFDPPVVVYVKGSYLREDALAIGVVGSRECTPYGDRQAARFAAELASLGVTVVSGLARGVDTKAHGGALGTKEGRTIAVLGSGLNQVYPPENKRLFDAICGRGCAMSEFPLNARPEPANFPRRNRLISGLSLGIVVVEASRKSGALITADWAMEQGKDVFAVPGGLENPQSRGPHALIKQGAKLVEDAFDILEEIPALAPILEKIGRPVALSPIENTILKHVGDKPRSVEGIAAASRLPESSVATALTELLAKKVVRLEGAGYLRQAPPAGN